LRENRVGFSTIGAAGSYFALNDTSSRGAPAGAAAAM
jgi:hypothetical protein